MTTKRKRNNREPHPCECGCGRIITPYKIDDRGHWSDKRFFSRDCQSRHTKANRPDTASVLKPAPADHPAIQKWLTGYKPEYVGVWVWA